MVSKQGLAAPNRPSGADLRRKTQDEADAGAKEWPEAALRFGFWVLKSLIQRRISLEFDE
jgi:hypothetical protein